MMRPTLFILPFVLLIVLLGPESVLAQRDHLTPQEADMVKDARVLDSRIDVFVKAADRRLIVLTGNQLNNSKQLKKDSEKWGELPNGSRAELITDIAKILDEAIRYREVSLATKRATDP